MDEDLMAPTLDGLLEELRAEVDRACSLHPPYNSHHEAYGVLMEEVEEYFDEVKKKTKDRDLAALRAELLQVAAVALRAAGDLT